MRARRHSSVQTRNNHVVLTCDRRPSLGNDAAAAAECRSRDRLRHFRFRSPAAEVGGGGYGGCRLYRSFVDDCDICRPRRAAADGSPTPPAAAAGTDYFRSTNGGGPPKMAAIDGACDVIRTVTSSSSAGRGALECPECLAESGRSLHSTVDRADAVGPLAADIQLPRSPITI